MTRSRWRRIPAGALHTRRKSVGLLSTTLLTTFWAFAVAQPAPAPAAPAAPASTPEVKALVDRMQAFYEKVGDFTASFKQDYTYKIAKRTQTSTGKVTFRK